MNSQSFVIFALQFAVMLAAALILGQFMRRIKQPAVLGELFGGIILGPTIFGLLFPAAYNWLFNSSPEAVVMRDSSIKLGMLFFLFTAGLEINLDEFNRVGKKALIIGLIGTLLPILLGIGLVYLIPRGFWGTAVQNHLFVFGLFVGMNLANSANPVIARILMDIGLLKEEIGAIIMTSTLVDDLINWTIFAVIISLIDTNTPPSSTDLGISLLLVLTFFVVMLTLGRWIAPRALHWVKQKVAWPSGFVAMTAVIILVASGIAEGLGIGAFFGAFLVGVAVSGKHPDAEDAHNLIAQFVMSFFAPIYFISIGMTTNFANHFDVILILVILLAAFITKFSSVILGAKVSGMALNRQVMAIAAGLNARGATGIILAGIGLQKGLIDERIFVAFFIMAVLTSMASGPLMNMFLKGKFTLAIPDKKTLPDIIRE